GRGGVGESPACWRKGGVRVGRGGVLRVPPVPRVLRAPRVLSRLRAPPRLPPLQARSAYPRRYPVGTPTLPGRRGEHARRQRYVGRPGCDQISVCKMAAPLACNVPL